ncbi:hypothetical protein WJX84_011395 [Apatococcus fuscideae]|uniref:Uncharacterized protein n=1 Tax=Apatococcus fuscideae TaxID=2026836 RepID=A0AAW1T2Y2_9CHLO
MQQGTGVAVGTVGTAPATSSMTSPAGGMVSPEYVASQEQLFYLSEKMLAFSSDDFNIKDISGHTVFKVDAALLSIKGARALTDAFKHTILTMQHKLLGAGTWSILRGNASTNETLAVVKKPHGLGKMLSSSHQGPVVTVHFSHTMALGTHAQPDMVITGDVMGKGYTITQGSTLVAEVSRALALNTSKFKLSGKDAYAVKVAAGHDCAFVLALAVIIDELYHD